MATFSKRHYILLAEALRTARARNAALPETVAGIDKATNFIASALSEDNDRFNYAHFTAVVRGEREIGSRPPKPWYPTQRCKVDRCHHLCVFGKDVCHAHESC